MIPGIYKSIAKLNPSVKPPLVKNEGYRSIKNDFNYRLLIVSLNLLTNSMRPEAQFVVRQCAPFIADPKLPHNSSIKCILEYLKGTVMQDLFLKIDP